MNHLTLHTGHARVSPRSEVADHVLTIVAPMLAVGSHVVPGVIGGYTLVVPRCERGWLGTVYQADIPIAMIGVAANEHEADEIWAALTQVYAKGRPWYGQPAIRPQAPWCAVALFIVAPAFDWLGDFERCLAWAWIDH